MMEAAAPTIQEILQYLTANYDHAEAPAVWHKRQLCNWYIMDFN